MKERHISQRKEGKRQNKKKVVEEEKEEEEKVGTRIRRGLKASRRIKKFKLCMGSLEAFGSASQP